MAGYFKRSRNVEQPKPIETVTAVAAAVVAFRMNGYKIEKYDTAAYQSTDIDGHSYTVPAVRSNKTLALEVLDKGTITQADRDEAVEVIQHIHSQVTMSLLAGKKVSDFVKEVSKALEEEMVPQFKIGLLVYAPNVHHTAKAREAITEQTTECLYTSQALGAVNTKVTVDFTLIEKRFVLQLGCYSAYGKDNKGNLVSFLSRHEELCESGMRVGKIKKCGTDPWHNDAMVTSLNYVKAV